MPYLIFASIIWSFSFGLIKGNLSALHPNLISFIRMGLSFFIFIPFIGIKNIDLKIKLRFILIGVVQYGFMYIAYIYSYGFLKSYEVALFTIFTPFYVLFIHDTIRKRLIKKHLFIALLAIIGAAIITYGDITSSSFLVGFILIQLSNIFFAWGQVKYRDLMREREDLKDRNIFAYLYFGAFIVTFVAVLFTVDIKTVLFTSKEIYTLLYLGTIPSGIAFFLWNYGVRKSKIGTISVFNNLKIPFAIIISMTIFGEDGNLIRILIGCLILISAITYNELSTKKSNGNFW